MELLFLIASASLALLVLYAAGIAFNRRDLIPPDWAVAVPPWR